jgi:hypothetical protein
MVGIEQKRLREADSDEVPWRRWGPYLSERQWGTVREDYSLSGDAWSSFSHDQARLTGIFLRGEDGRRPVHGGQPTLQNDPHWRDLLLFYEYFHGDNGAGIGASHQTGWTGTVALLPLVTRAFRSEGLAAGGMGQLIGTVTRVGEALVP